MTEPKRPGLDEAPVEDLAFLTRWLRTTHDGTLSGRRIEALAAAVRADERAKVLAEVANLCDWLANFGGARDRWPGEITGHRAFHFGNPCPYVEVVPAALTGKPDPRRALTEPTP